jgi:pantetheine-phosphate adenylyltransferase
MDKKYKKVAVGGTFDRFHYGHRKLLEKAFEIGEIVIIGVTSDVFGGKKGDIDPCDKRISNLNQFLVTKHHGNFYISRLDDPYGTTIYENDFDAIVVSKETEPTAIEINEIRKNKRMKTIKIVAIDFVFADDGIPISSTRIRNGEIDIKGHLLDG